MSEISKQALKVDNSTSFPNNTTGYISPTILRAFNVNMIDSLVEQAGYTANSASWNVSIGQLNTYTASFAPSLTQLNAFTASQLTINTGVNQFTQSTNASINRLNTFSSSFNPYTASINQIQSNGVTLGTSTRFNLVGPGTFFSASLVQNVGGPIATLTFTSDNAKVNTSSFNDYTASTAAAFASYSSSVSSSLNQLFNFSSSLDATYATDAQLNASASTLQANINTKLNTSSFNAFTASQSVLNSTFLTTGSASGSQSTLGAFNMNMMYTSSFGQAAVTSSAGYVYFDYSLLQTPQFTFWTTSDGQTFVDAGQVTISGTGVSSQPISLNFDYQDFGVGIPVTGSGVNGATYTFSGPYYHDLTVTGSITSTYQQQVIGLDGRKTVQDANGIYGITANSLVQAGLSVDQGVYVGDNANSNYIGLAATASQVQSQSGPTTFDTPQIWANQNNQGAFTQISFQGNDNYTDGTITFHKPSSFKESVTTTGSVYGNVMPLTITSNTASMNLTGSNFFTLNLVSGSSTRLVATNVKPGQTINLLVSQPAIGTGTLTYGSQFKFAPGNQYTASAASGSKDILTFITFDNSSVYASALKSLQ